MRLLPEEIFSIEASVAAEPTQNAARLSMSRPDRLPGPDKISMIRATLFNSLHWQRDIDPSAIFSSMAHFYGDGACTITDETNSMLTFSY
jgi:hypothetical protein